MVFILSRLIARASHAYRDGSLPSGAAAEEEEAWWEAMMLLPEDYGVAALHEYRAPSRTPPPPTGRARPPRRRCVRRDTGAVSV